jgi:hypothetical protein
MKKRNLTLIMDSRFTHRRALILPPDATIPQHNNQTHQEQYAWRVRAQAITGRMLLARSKIVDMVDAAASVHMAAVLHRMESDSRQACMCSKHSWYVDPEEDRFHLTPPHACAAL